MCKTYNKTFSFRMSLPVVSLGDRFGVSIEGGAGGRYVVAWMKVKTASGTNGPKAVPKYNLKD